MAESQCLMLSALPRERRFFTLIDRALAHCRLARHSSRPLEIPARAAAAPGLEGVFPGLGGSNPQSVVHGADKDPVLPGFACPGGSDDGLGGDLRDRVAHDDLYFDLWQQIQRGTAASIDLPLLPLRPEAFDFADRQPRKAQNAEGVFHLFKFKWPDDGFDFFHETAQERACVKTGESQRAARFISVGFTNVARLLMRCGVVVTGERPRREPGLGVGGWSIPWSRPRR